MTKKLTRVPGGDRAQRRRTRVAFAGALVVLAVTAAACSGNSGPSEGALSGKSPTDIVSVAVKAYLRQPSVHYETKTVTGSQTVLQVGATSKKASVESVQAGKTPLLDAVLTGGVAYLQGGSQLLQNALGLSASAASAHAGSWISIHHGDSAYTTVTRSLGPSEAIATFLPNSPGLKVAGVTHFSGQDVIAVQGSPAGSLSAGSTGVVTLFVSTTAPYLPIGATLVVKDSTGKTLESSASVYGKWHQKVDPKAPTGATPLSSITR